MIGPQKILVPFFVFASINFELDTVKVEGGPQDPPYWLKKTFQSMKI